MFRDLERLQAVFTGIAAHRGFGANLTVQNEPVSAQGMLVSGSYFPTLGLQAAHGRLLTPSDDAAIGAGYVAVLSHEFWQDKFGGHAGVVGRTINVNGASFTVVGIAPRDFRGTVMGAEPVMYIPISMRQVIARRFNAFENRRSYWIYAFARLKPGVTIAQATSALNALYKPLLADVEAPLQTGMSDQTMGRFKAKSITMEPGPQGQSSMQATAKTPLLMLFAITGVVLLIACANIANLLLVRTASRERERAVRAALGGSRSRIAIPLFAEVALVAMGGALLALLLAQGGIRLLVSMAPENLSRLDGVGIDPMVLGFAMLATVLAALLFGMMPVLRGTRFDLATVL